MKYVVINGLVCNPQVLNSWNLENYLLVDINAREKINLEDLAQEISLHATAATTILAYSCGSILGMKLLNDYPDKFKHLIAINSTPYFMQQDNWLGIKKEALDNLQLRLGKVKQLSTEQFQRYFLRLAATPLGLSKEELNHYLNPQATFTNLEYWLQLIKKSDLRALAKELKAKITWINASQDLLVPAPQQHANHILPLKHHLDVANPLLVMRIHQLCD